MSEKTSSREKLLEELKLYSKLLNLHKEISPTVTSVSTKRSDSDGKSNERGKAKPNVALCNRSNTISLTESTRVDRVCSDKCAPAPKAKSSSNVAQQGGKCIRSEISMRKSPLKQYSWVRPPSNTTGIKTDTVKTNDLKCISKSNSGKPCISKSFFNGNPSSVNQINKYKLVRTSTQTVPVSNALTNKSKNLKRSFTEGSASVVSKLARKSDLQCFSDQTSAQSKPEVEISMQNQAGDFAATKDTDVQKSQGLLIDTYSKNKISNDIMPELPHMQNKTLCSKYKLINTDGGVDSSATNQFVAKHRIIRKQLKSKHLQNPKEKSSFMSNNIINTEPRTPAFRSRFKLMRRRSGNGHGTKMNSPAPNKSLLLKSRYKLVKHAKKTIIRNKTYESVPKRHVNLRSRYNLVKEGVKLTSSNQAPFHREKRPSIRSRTKLDRRPVSRVHQNNRLVRYGRPNFAWYRRSHEVFGFSKKRSHSVRENFVSLKGQLYLKRGRRLTRIGAMKVSKDKGNASSLSRKEIGIRRSSICPFQRKHSMRDVITETTLAQIRARNILAKSLAALVQMQAMRRAVRVRGSDNKAPASHRHKAAAKYCIYYNRFGRCSRGVKCPFMHDPKRIAVCSRFLRGTCHFDSCPFSHNLAKEKMPVCSYFLKGRCSKEDCPYLHVNVGQSAAVCEDFLNGYCAAGQACKKKHSTICPDFARDGKCSKGRQCKLQHVKPGMKRTLSKTNTKVFSSKESGAPQRKRARIETDDRDLPLSQRDIPAYISIETHYLATGQATQDTKPKASNTNDSSSPSLQIRPRFMLHKDTS